MFALPIDEVVEPTRVHVLPSDDTKPVIVEPARVSFSHTGAAAALPAMKFVMPPVVERVMNSMPPPGFTSRITCADPAVSVSRSITPAFANVFVFCTLATRVTTCPSPASAWYT